MTSTHWHVQPDLLGRFALAPNGIDATTAASIEVHLVVCSECRQQLTTHADPTWTATSWEAIADRIDQPRVTPFEWLLGRLGMRGGIARLVAATPALQIAGFASVVVIAVAAVLMSRSRGTDGPFLVLAPLAPLAAVTASFASAADPGGEAGVATPVHGAALVIRRAAVVLTVTIGVLSLAAIGLPGFGVEAAAWVLPALALSLGALALGTWLRVETALGGLTVAWLFLVWWGWWAGGRVDPVVESITFTALGQICAAVAAVIAIAVLVVRRDRFATLEVR